MCNFKNTQKRAYTIAPWEIWLPIEIRDFKLLSRIDIFNISYDISLKWMPQNLNDD